VAHFLTPMLATSAPPLHLGRRGHGAPLATTLEPAFDSASRKRGLLQHEALAPATALLIAPCGAVHTFGMRFAIDVIFAARDGRVVKIVPSLAPRRIAVALKAFATVEMAAGEAARHGVSVGDYLELRSADQLTVKQ